MEREVVCELLSPLSVSTDSMNRQLSSADFREMITYRGVSVGKLSEESPVLLVFLRHLGCVFCREALRDISSIRDSMLSYGGEIVLVHMEKHEVAIPVLVQFGLGGVHHIEDVQQAWYQRFGLVRGSFSQLFGLKTMVRGFNAGMSLDQFGGSRFGDAFQMPGVFVVYREVIVSEYVHRSVSDRPDYMQLMTCCIYEK